MPMGLPTTREARAAGRSLGETFPNVWEPDWWAAARVDERVTGWLIEQPVRRSRAHRIWLTALILCATSVASEVAILLIISRVVPRSELPLSDPVPAYIAATLFVVGVVGLLVTVIGNSIARTRSRSRREDHLALVHDLMISSALDEIRARRAVERAEAVSPPPIAAPLGASATERVDLAAAWLNYVGSDTEIDSRRRDGVDIFTDAYVVRVVQEAEDAKTAMREIAAAAARTERIGVVMLNDIPSDALTLAARSAGLAVLVMTVEDGSLIALSDEAARLIARKMEPQSV